MARSLSVLALLALLCCALPAFSQALVDVSIVKTASATDVLIGGNFNYVLTIANSGPSTATNVTVTDILPTSPAQMTASSAVASQGSCSGTTTVTCNLGSILNGGTATVTITTSAPAAGDYSNTGTVASTEPDSNSANNSSTIRVTAIAPTPAIPTAGTWALLAMAGLLLTAAIVRLRF